MRALLVSLALGLCAAPAVARADLSLRCGTLDGAAPRERAGARLELPALSLDADLGGSLAAPLDEGGGAGATSGTTSALALILGIFPGFGIGHLVANSPRWTFWLVIDIALLFADVFLWAYGPDPLDVLAWVATIVERVVEGIDAFQSAGGRLAGVGPDPVAPRWAFARPVKDPATSVVSGPAVARF